MRDRRCRPNDSFELLDGATVNHRAWLDRIFSDLLPKAPTARRQALHALHVATDAGTWKLLRRDLQLSRAGTERIMRELVYGIFGGAGARTRRGGRIPGGPVEAPPVFVRAGRWGWRCPRGPAVRTLIERRPRGVVLADDSIAPGVTSTGAGLGARWVRRSKESPAGHGPIRDWKYKSLALVDRLVDRLLVGAAAAYAADVTEAIT